MKTFFVFCFFIVCTIKGISQEIPRFNPDTIKTITLDSVVNITAKRLNVETFIAAVIADTSFYKAFQNMKRYAFIAENRIYTYDKKNRINGTIYRKIKHNIKAPKMEYLIQQEDGKIFKKNGKFHLYTIEMFDYIFVNAYKSEFSNSTANHPPVKGDAHATYKDKLKTLIFSPGKPVHGLPFIGKKTEIFTPNMRQYYDYSFYSATYLDSIPVYRFKVAVKPDLSNWTKDGLMIKELITLFDKRTFEILGRYVEMKYSNLLFNFDVKMNIEMSYFGEEKLPVKISFQGNWNVPLKKEERASVLILHKDYQN